VDFVEFFERQPFHMNNPGADYFKLV
jgi:hypothetical protein